jgi:hypothetical protein
MSMGKIFPIILPMTLRRDLSKKGEEGAPPSLEKYTTFTTIQKYIPRGNEDTTYSSHHTQIHSFIEKHPQNNTFMRVL